MLALCRPGEGLTGLGRGGGAARGKRNAGVQWTRRPRGRRGDGRGDWARWSGGVKAAWEPNRQRRRLGKEDPARIARARRKSNRSPIGSTRQVYSEIGHAQRDTTSFISQYFPRIELWSKICEYKSCREKSKLQLSYWDFSLIPHGF